MTAPTMRGGPPDLKLIAERRAALLAQCAPSSPTVSPDGADSPVFSEKWGDEGPRVILVHGGVQGGLGGGPVTWDGQRALAERGWRIERVERPGFGRSPSRGPDDMERDAEWIAELLGDGAVLVGHSWGGAEALLAAARKPHAVRGLVLVEPALHPLLIGAPEAADPLVLMDLGKIPAMLLEAATPADYGRRFAAAMGAVDQDDQNAAATALREDQASAALGCALLRARMADPGALRAALSTVADARIPVLAISGGWSPAFDAIAQLVARVAAGHTAIVSAPHHFVQQAATIEFNTVMDAFLRNSARDVAGSEQTPA